MERYSDNAIDIIDNLHTERLDYNSEYLPLINAANKLQEYEDREENGLLMRLPCKVGDTVWYIVCGEKIYKGMCHAITIHRNSIQVHLYDYDGDNASYSDKDIFLTREEAEQALKARGEDEFKSTKTDRKA